MLRVILARAEEYGHNRDLICGVHYSTDVPASKLLAYTIHAIMEVNPEIPAGTGDRENRIDANPVDWKLRKRPSDARYLAENKQAFTPRRYGVKAAGFEISAH